jgi:RES domain-containing protein
MSTPRAARGPENGTIAVEWPQAWRIVASRYPPINLFERVSPDPAVWDVLIELEQLTNPRVRDEVGEISRVPPRRRVRGPNASWVMAAFTHVNPKGSRFSNGMHGVYYAADRLKTAIAETAHHFARFARDSNDPPRREDMRVLLGSVANRFHDADQLPSARRSAVLDPDSYVESQRFADELRARGSNGIVYPSVRDAGGRCVAAFWPDAVRPPVQERHLKYEWDGSRVSRYFDYSLGEWSPI